MFLIESTRKYLGKYKVSMHGYFIVSNHFHILISAHHGENIKMFIQQSLRDSSIKITTELGRDVLTVNFPLKQKVFCLFLLSTPGGKSRLILSKEFIEKHGGKIWVENKIGQEATFYFTLSKNPNNSQESINGCR